MSVDISKLVQLNDLVSSTYRRKHIIVLDPEEGEDKRDINNNIIYDKIRWYMPEAIQTLVDELSKNTKLSNEDKIFLIYQKICRDYIYDDNVISYIHKIDDESYTLPDWYGRDVNHEWERNREQHNRRVCYEVSRYLAKALEELFKKEDDYNICILWDKSHTHYFVGLNCKDYAITLDVDDFNNIKDLTRIKTDLTAEGIVILDDKKGKFNGALDRFNEGKSKDAVKKIKHDIVYNDDSLNSDKENQTSSQLEEPDNIVFLRNAIDILKDKYNIDSQGLYEYMKEIIDVTLGPESRKKVWKEIKEKNNSESRYTRCLLIDEESQKYIIDVEDMTIRKFDEKELEGEDRNYIPFKELLSEELLNYRNRKDQRYTGR